MFVPPSTPPTTPYLVEPPKGREYITIGIAFVLILLLLGLLVYSFFPHFFVPETTVEQTPFEEAGHFPDDEIVTQSVTPVHLWYLTPLEERSYDSPYYPWRIREFHNPSNPIFY